MFLARYELLHEMQFVFLSTFIEDAGFCFALRLLESFNLVDDFVIGGAVGDVSSLCFSAFSFSVAALIDVA